LAEDKAVNVGVAAHITAASPGGPRYDESLPQEERRGASNAIWLCHICAKLIDSDIPRFPTDLLRKWKQDAIERAFTAIATSGSGNHRRGAIVLELDDTDREFLLESPNVRGVSAFSNAVNDAFAQQLRAVVASDVRHAGFYRVRHHAGIRSVPLLTQSACLSHPRAGKRPGALVQLGTDR
jgi:hypothetical protein